MDFATAHQYLYFVWVFLFDWRVVFCLVWVLFVVVLVWFGFLVFFLFVLGSLNLDTALQLWSDMSQREEEP